MKSLVWLAIPLGALALGVLWTFWAGRSRPRADTHETLREHEKFKAAFEAQGPDRGGRPGR